MKNLCILSCLLFLALSQIKAQCPVSTEPGIHVVQPNETLYKISKKHGVSINELCYWNNMLETDLLPVCKRLIVRGSAFKVEPIPGPSPQPINNNTPTNTANFSKLQKQAGNRHVVQAGETTADLARLYGYTEERFREFNAMGGEEVSPGSIVLSHDCACDRVMFSENANPNQPAYASNDNPITTTYYSYDPAPPTNKNEHVPLSTSDVEYGRIQPKEKPVSTPPSEAKPTSTSDVRAASSFMQSREIDMVNEINMMRANPAGYVKYINEYVADQRANNGFPVDQAVVDELNRELNKTGRLSQLKTKECIYVAAKKHGQDILKMGRTDHIGSDGKWPWDRVRRECPDLTDGNENLVGGPSTVREAVVILLIDEGIPNRGHRNTLLRSDWEYVACYSIGQVGMMPNCWVQKFGF